MPVGYFVKSSGSITSVITNAYEQNGYDVTVNGFYPFPDYFRGVFKYAGNVYIAQEHGWLYIYSSAFADDMTAKVDINGQVNIVGHGALSGSGYAVGCAIMLPVPKGHYYVLTDINYAIFYPARILSERRDYVYKNSK